MFADLVEQPLDVAEERAHVGAARAVIGSGCWAVTVLVGWRIIEVIIELMLHAEQNKSGRRCGHCGGGGMELRVGAAVDAALHVVTFEVVPQVAAPVEG